MGEIKEVATWEETVMRMIESRKQLPFGGR